MSFVSFLFLAVKFTLENSKIFFRILYLLKLRHVVTDFPCLVASWFRQNFDQIESILQLFYYFFKYMFF